MGSGIALAPRKPIPLDAGSGRTLKRKEGGKESQGVAFLARFESMAKAKGGNPNWVKGGASPNPGGRKPLPEEFRARCRKAAEESLPRLLAEVEEGGQYWVKAWELLAAYGYGRPTQPIAGEDGGPVQVAATVVILPQKDGQ